VSKSNGIAYRVLQAGDAKLCAYEHPSRKLPGNQERGEQGLHGFNHFTLRITNQANREAVAKNLAANIRQTQGTREYLTCEAGTVELWVEGESWLLSPGGVLVFRGDQKHSYVNPGKRVAVAYSMLVLAPRSI
jgi:mannose-6-phosphate isomerase-like protein (cupin superfamily)